jgi:hypothetical protein
MGRRTKQTIKHLRTKQTRNNKATHRRTPKPASEENKTRGRPPMPTNCLTCPTCQTLKGSDKQECAEYKWTFSKELAESQALCDNRVNTPYPTVTEDVPTD